MNKKFKKYYAYYISLSIILSLGLFSIIVVSPNVGLMGVFLLLTVIFYILWGLVHHMINHELTTKIMVEYILIGLLGLSFLFLIFMGGIV